VLTPKGYAVTIVYGTDTSPVEEGSVGKMGLTPNARTQGHVEWQQRPVYARVVELVDTMVLSTIAEMRLSSRLGMGTSGSLGHRVPSIKASRLLAWKHVVR